MTDYDEAIKALVGQRWSDDEANYLSWLVETGRSNDQSKEAVFSRIAQERKDHDPRSVFEETAS